MKSQCEEYWSLMADSLSAGLSAGQNRELRRHLGACPDCREYLRRLRSDDGLLTAFTQTMQQAVSRVENSAMGSLRGDSRISHSAILPRRTVHVRVWAKFAAVITIVCLVAVTASHFLGSLRVSTVSLAQTLEAMRTTSWLHSVETLSTEPTAVRECWECFDTHIVGCRTPDGKIEYTDYAANTAYRYNPNSNKITVSFTTDTYMLPRPQTSFEMLTQIIDDAEEVGARMTSHPVVENGRNLERMILTLDDYPYCGAIVLLRACEGITFQPTTSWEFGREVG